MNYIVIVAILFPVIAGLLIPYFKFSKSKRQIYTISAVIMTSLLALLVIFLGNNEPLTLISLTSQMPIAFKVDGLSKVFLLLIAILWPLATLYAFEYMEHEPNHNRFFMLYTLTFGVVIGLATSANLVTFYFMYECLTFATLPLVMHAMDRRAIKAGRKYFQYSIFGAALAFCGMMILMHYGSSIDFVYGGVLASNTIGNQLNIVLFGYLLMFFGFGVKAAIFPFHGWLPSAGVAPTPVTALLHAVAVVKAGVFAIMRVTFYSFGTAVLYGTWAQYVALGFACFTIVFGSTMAFKEQHLKRRFAYSTISNLSYILVGISLMTPLGLAGALAHMFFHGIMKICLFFCVGVVMEKTHKEFVYQVEGFGRKMPVTFVCFTVGACALSGIPLFAGFVSKAALGSAAVAQSSIFSLIVVMSLLLSAILTAAYTFEISIKAFIPHKGFNTHRLDGKKDPEWMMKTPLLTLSALMILFGIWAGPIMEFFTQVAKGL